MSKFVIMRNLCKFELLNGCCCTYTICPYCLFSIFTAFVLEVFMLEYTLNQTELENVMESRIKDMGLGEGQ